MHCYNMDDVIVGIRFTTLVLYKIISCVYHVLIKHLLGYTLDTSFWDLGQNN